MCWENKQLGFLYASLVSSVMSVYLHRFNTEIQSSQSSHRELCGPHLAKVLHILDSLNRGGAETMMLDVCRNAKQNGLDLTFVATGGGELEPDFRGSGVEFVRLNRRLPVDLSLASKLRRIIKERHIQVVHSHQPVEALHVYLATRNSEIKRVLTLHGVYPGTKNELALKFVLPRTNAKVVVSDDLLSRMKKEQGVSFRKNVVVIKNGVDPKRLRTQGRKLFGELGLAIDELLLGMVGNFQPVARKDQLTVCKALPELFERVPRAHFAFIGGRSESAPQLFDDCVNFCRQQNISDRVHFLGTRANVNEVLHSLDIFVLSTLREGSPISVIEAMMIGVPAILSDISALREISDDGEYAVLFQTGDADDLAAKLIELVNDPDGRARLSSKARPWAMGQFGIDRHIANLSRLYESFAM
jgi:glycosyltransferase involved in cell wall biosynthesis